MQLNQVPWNELSINNHVKSDMDQVGGIITNLETIDGGTNLITILWDTNIQMKFNHAWTTEITLGE